MLVDATVEASKAWNTWSNRPAELVFLPLGVRLTPVLFSSRAAKATTIRPGADLLLGRHGLDGEAIEFETRHGGSRLSFAYRKADPYIVTGRWTALDLAEWGLRYWVSLCLSAESGATVRYDAAEGATVVEVGTRFVALVTRDRPVQVTAHADVAALVADFDAHGYFYKGSRGTEAPALALRFELEMAHDGAFAAAVADSAALAIAKAKAALADPAPEPALPAQTGRYAGALDAVRDVMAWNTLRDTDSRRNFTATSRMWDLGGFAVWFNDQTYAALMTNVFDRAAGYENMAAAMASATPQGNFTCLLSTTDQWVDRSQAPNGAFMAWMMYLRTRERSGLDFVYEPLARNQRWWREHRDPTRLGLVSCGTSDVGDGMYKGLHFGARNETGMDNSATHDEAVYDPETRTLSTLDVGLNAVLALDAQMLALIARELGRDAEAAEFEALAASSRDLIRTELWNEARGLFANRQRTGGFVRSVGPTSFYPLLCGAATPEQAKRLLAHLDDPESFGGDWIIPNASRDDPAYKDNVYWRGRIWPNVNYFLWHALRAAGFEDEAGTFARKSFQLFEKSWAEQRIVAENYNAETGEAMDQGDTDPFYSWGAMLPLLGVAEVMDFNPWGGWEVRNTGEPVRLGPVESPVGPVELRVEDGVLTLRSASRIRLETDLVGRLSHLTLEPNFVSLRLHPASGAQETARLALPDIAPDRLVAARMGGRDLAPLEGQPFLAFDLSGAAAGERLDIHLTPLA
ncbi:MGH1-like glycoside hydrolase domain-containing protein [Aureimonas sp. Leaf427]|nr:MULTISPECIES: trehalase family glycosidase [unclassified Aureimonas]KQT55377.1 glycoside hydrolase family 37 [Aureimonas sp. Leaf427]KQT71013.1 glycoside hydrolase family 37 [Aureimonas sp. Leaf460]